MAKKMFFYLMNLSRQMFIKEEVPVLPESTPENERFIVIEAWKHSDFLCKNYILSGLKGDLYNVYSNVGTSKELSDALEKKYKTEDDRLKKFIAVKFLDYKMVDGLVISGAFQVATIIEKFPPLWKDFKNYLKYKRKEMTLEDLIIRLRIEEDNHAAEKKANGRLAIGGAHIVETAPTNPKKKEKGVRTKELSRQEEIQGKLPQLWKNQTQNSKSSCSEEGKEKGSS
ncbi:uncharacterized protein LOC132057649 [Lycium ferocissimum]|uniref:uncharacterized protein LOC132057649 n=1 Tax=Lycium ferocissimum TaxID=112874 RepID=UPI002815810B|nr:uncharacterized protein LOC132057649 [Lycium ferocissimum]